MNSAKLSVSLDEIFGALLLGFTLSVFLFGICVTQLYMYVLNYPKDVIWMRALAWFVCLVELVHLLSSAQAAYLIFITGFGDIRTLQRTHAGFHVSAITANLISTIVKAFFVFRIWALSRNVYLILVISLLTMGTFGTYLAASICGIQEITLLEYGLKYQWLIILSPSLSALTDVLITVSLSFLLWGKIQRSLNSSKDSLPVAEKIMVWTLETGLWQRSEFRQRLSLRLAHKFHSLFQLGLAISAGVSTISLIWLGLWLCTCRCYANSLFAVLNGRLALRSGEDTRPLSSKTTSLAFANPHYERVTRAISQSGVSSNATPSVAVDDSSTTELTTSREKSSQLPV